MSRTTKSKFDPFISDIKFYLNLGLSIQDVAEQIDQYFDDAVDSSALYNFIQSRGLDYKRARGNRVPVCNKCDCCFEIIDINGKGKRTCHSVRIIADTVKTSPQWCHKRERQAG